MCLNNKCAFSFLHKKRLVNTLKSKALSMKSYAEFLANDSRDDLKQYIFKMH